MCTDQIGKFFAKLPVLEPGLLSLWGKAGIIDLRQRIQEAELCVSSLGGLEPPTEDGEEGTEDLRSRERVREKGARTWWSPL